MIFFFFSMYFIRLAIRILHILQANVLTEEVHCSPSSDMMRPRPTTEPRLPHNRSMGRVRFSRLGCPMCIVDGYYCWQLDRHYCFPFCRIAVCRVETESDGTRRRTGGEVKGKEANGEGSQQFSDWLGTVHPVLLQSFSADPHSKKASTRLNWHPRRYNWTRPFRWQTESGFCACAITYRTVCTS